MLGVISRGLRVTNPHQNDPLLTLRQTLTAAHVEDAIDYVRAASEAAKDDSSFRYLVARLRALSAIMHAYAAIEAAVNDEGHLLLFDTRSSKYIPAQARTLGIDLIARSWHRAMSLPDKVRFIAEHGNFSLPPRLETELRELGTLRNYVAHGVVFESTLLVSPAGDGIYNVHDRDDSIPWSAKFPNLKFHSLDRLDHEDAIAALRVAVEILVVVASASHLPVAIVRQVKGQYNLTEITATTDVKRFLKTVLLAERAGKSTPRRKP
jgi:hypothetical protein